MAEDARKAAAAAAAARLAEKMKAKAPPAAPSAPPPPPPGPAHATTKPSGPPRLGGDDPCTRKATKGGHVCRIGGGDACYTDDMGRTWFCSGHRPADFLPSDRGDQ